VVAVTIPEVLSQLHQVKQQIERARAMIQAALAEVTQADALLHTTLGNIRDPSPYTATAQTRQHLTDADQAATQVTAKADEWIAKIEGTTPGK
jgi:prefoldin subunit 5